MLILLRVGRTTSINRVFVQQIRSQMLPAFAFLCYPIVLSDQSPSCYVLGVDGRVRCGLPSLIGRFTAACVVQSVSVHRGRWA